MNSPTSQDEVGGPTLTDTNMAMGTGLGEPKVSGRLGQDRVVEAAAHAAATSRSPC